MFGITSTNIIQYILSLPVILLALSIHETAHGYIANKLGDPTAKSLGRLTLNPIKHIDVLGFLCMLFFHFGWAKPVPVNARYFKKPRRDMALTSAAGPCANIILALVFALFLRLEILIVEIFFSEELQTAINTNADYMSINMLSVLSYLLYMGVVLNISLAVFNLIPIPPFDGSRIAYVFLPQKLYFYVMKYERFIMFGILALLWFVPMFSGLIGNATRGLSSLVLSVVGMTPSSYPTRIIHLMFHHLITALFA